MCTCRKSYSLHGSEKMWMPLCKRLRNVNLVMHRKEPTAQNYLFPQLVVLICSSLQFFALPLCSHVDLTLILSLMLLPWKGSFILDLRLTASRVISYLCLKHIRRDCISNCTAKRFRNLNIACQCNTVTTLCA